MPFWVNVLLVVFLVCTAGISTAQARQAPNGFDVDAVSKRAAAGETDVVVDLYAQVPYTSLRFLNTPDGFTARYEMLVEAYAVDDRNRRQDLVQRQTWNESITVANFAATQLHHLHDRTTRSLKLPPGRYALDVQVEDPATNRLYRQEHSLVVRDLSRSIAVSDIMLVETFGLPGEALEPHISSHVGAEQLHMKVYYEMYAPRTQRIRSTLEVVRPRRGGLPLVGSLFGLVRDDEVDIDYATSQWVNLESGRKPTFTTIPLENLEVGDYVVRLRLETEDGTLLDATEKAITVEQWQGLETHIMDLASAIDQLKYIAKERDLNYIREAPTEEEQRQRFQEFWQRRDPTPGTDRNERMMEYYYRVDYANRRYGTRGSGWQTDRGQVLVLFGQPDLIEQFDGEQGDSAPYQVWHYKRIGRQFIFIDQTGHGDFRLRTPLNDRIRIR